MSDCPAPNIRRKAIARTHTGHRCGEGHHRAKLSDEIVRKMRETYAQWKENHEPFGYQKLGELFNCSPWTARDIVTGRTRWRSG